MTMWGYARVSSAEQSLDIQLVALAAAGAETIRSEKMSGTSRQGRKELDRLLSEVLPGDSIIITRIDRLARSIVDLLTIVDDLKRRGVARAEIAKRLNVGRASVYRLLNPQTD